MRGSQNLQELDYSDKPRRSKSDVMKYTINKKPKRNDTNNPLSQFKHSRQLIY